jgi:hypothetical protein
MINNLRAIKAVATAARAASTAAAAAAGGGGQSGGGAKQDEPLRFGVGAAVECLCEEGWMRGEVVAHHYRESDWKVGRYVPYQVKLLNDMKIRVPVDENATIRAAAAITAEERRSFKVLRFDIGAAASTTATL